MYAAVRGGLRLPPASRLSIPQPALFLLPVHGLEKYAQLEAAPQARSIRLAREDDELLAPGQEDGEAR